MDPAQPITIHGTAEVCAWLTGQGVILGGGGPAKAVSVGSQTTGATPHGVAALNLTTFNGITDGAKKSIVPISTAQMIL